MSPEDAYSILEAMAIIHNCTDKLQKHTLSADEAKAENTAEEISEERKERLAPFAFSLCNILPGAELEFWSNALTATGIKCTVADDKHVEYEGKKYSLSALAQKLLDSRWPVAGPRYFKYQGEWLNTIRDRINNL